MKKHLVFAIILLALVVAPGVQAQSKTLTAAEAKNHVGERATVLTSMSRIQTRYLRF